MTGHHDPATHGSGEHTLGGWLRDTARRHPHKVAVDDRGVPTTYAELEERSEELARAFRRAGYGAGDRVATLTGNSVDHVVVFFACAKAGLTLVPLSWRLTVAELAANLAVARPALVLAEEERLLTAREALARAGISAPLTELGGNGVETTAPARHLSVGEAWPEQRPVRDDDGLLVIFTSGSEARPKGVVLTHANCFWNNLALARALELSSRDVVLSVLLQFHVAGWNCQPLAAWWLGATVVLEHNFVPSRVLQLIPARGVTTMMGVPTQYHLLAGEPRFADADLSTLRHVLVGGSTMPAPVLRAWQARDVDVIQGYGLTEASPNVLYLPASESAGRPGSVGRPHPYVEVRLVDPTTGAEVEGAGTGELQVRGPGVFAGYLDAPELTAGAIHDGWLLSGDIAERDGDGCYRIVDRLKHIYISGGENVAPAEVERVLMQHPLVAEAAVVAVDDPVWGEVGVAFVVPDPGVDLTAEEVIAHAREHLAAYKIPRTVTVVPELLRTGIDKVSRPQLRQAAHRLAERGPA